MSGPLPETNFLPGTHIADDPDALEDPGLDLDEVKGVDVDRTRNGEDTKEGSGVEGGMELGASSDSTNLGHPHCSFSSLPPRTHPQPLLACPAIPQTTISLKESHKPRPQKSLANGLIFGSGNSVSLDRARKQSSSLNYLTSQRSF
jgi:hypothetical protein